MASAARKARSMVQLVVDFNVHLVQRLIASTALWIELNREAVDADGIIALEPVRSELDAVFTNRRVARHAREVTSVPQAV